MKTFSLAVLAVLAISPAASAAKFQSATVKRVSNDVRIYQPDTAAVRASVGSIISGRTSLQTGRDSRSELEFQDKTLTRIGPNSVFSFQRGTRDLQLDRGTLLLQVPKGVGGARIRTATVTAAISGTTILMEYIEGKWVKVIVLEGSTEFFLNAIGRRVKVTAGQLLVMRADGKEVPQPVDINLNRLMETSLLVVSDAFGALPGPALALINQNIAQQGKLIQSGALFNPGSNPGSNPVLGGHPQTAGSQVSQTRQTVTDSIRTPERAARWYDYRPPGP